MKQKTQQMELNVSHVETSAAKTQSTQHAE